MPFSWFTGRKNVQKDLQILNEQIKKLENTIEGLMKTNKTQHIHIEQLTIDNPKLESLIFRMDSLDVEEVSGSLNLGNNFGVKVDRKTDSKETTNTFRDTKENIKVKEDANTVKKTDSGYRMYMNEKK